MDAQAGFAAELARRRAETGLSLADVGRAAHASRGYVHHIEQGQRWPSRGVAKALDAALGASGTLLTAWEAGDAMRRARRDHRAAATLVTLTAAVGPSDSPVADVVAMRTMVHAIQAADRQIGGGRLYPTVVRYLHDEVGPALVDAHSNADTGQLFAAAATLTDIAGWMAHDGGQDSDARGHFVRAYRLATAAGSDPLVGDVCASMSHLAGQLGQATDAFRIAEIGLTRARGADGTGRLTARLHAVRAQGLARRGEERSCTDALTAAERALALAGAGEPVEWTAHYDEGSLASETALCLLELGDLVGAERAAERVIELRDGDRVRSRAFGQLTLAQVLVRGGRPDEAAALGAAVCAVAPSLSSTRVRTRLGDLGVALHLHRKVAEVASFLGQLAALPPTRAREEPTWPV
ncbi:MAG: helix-turn-helix domain-containing protein [Pseudonocardiaceae bacterium]